MTPQCTRCHKLGHWAGDCPIGLEQPIPHERVDKAIVEHGIEMALRPFDQPTFLERIDNAKREILAADSMVKVKDLWNKADAMRALGQAAKDPELVNYATEFKLRCERKLGEMLRHEVKRGGQNKRSNTPVTSLMEIGVDRRTSSRAQRIAAVPEERFEAALATAREEEKQITRNTVEALIGHNHRAQGTGENEWYTPAKYIELAREVLGEIDLDPASTAIANGTVRAKSFFRLQLAPLGKTGPEEDGLTKEWAGRVWLNPPYAQPAIQLFSEKLVAEIEAGRVKAAIALTHNYTDTAWFHLLAGATQAICFTRGRIGFVDPAGKPCAPTQGQAFFYFGSKPQRFATVFLDTGFIVQPVKK